MTDQRAWRSFKRPYSTTSTRSAEGYTMVIVTHEMAFSRAVSDQVVFLEKGIIIENAPPEIFFTQSSNEHVRKFLERTQSF